MRTVVVLAILVFATLLPAGTARSASVDHIDAAGKWLQAIVAAARSGDVQGIEAAVVQYVQAVRNAVDEIHARQGSPPGLRVAAERVQEATQRHLKVLQELLQRVPEGARPAIQKAMEAASRGYEVATAALGKGVHQGKPSGPRGKQPGPGPKGKTPGEKHGKGRR